ncbi:MAG: carbonic anhydrase [Gammaproteobacteria bacterium]|nr:carbonic anhydrase [Gammaproteobacteria bacterium]
MNELEKLIAGFRQFRKRYYEDEPELFKQLINKGQSPKALVIACCDSRVHPAQVMDTDPGDIFVVRNVANVVPPCQDDGKSHGTSAAIEFAVKHLGVKHIIIFGHGQCGGVRSLMEGKHQDHKHGFIDAWMDIVAPAREKILKEHRDAAFDDQCRACELAVIDISVNNLMTFPWIREMVVRNNLFIHGWYFDIEQGILFERDKSEKGFSPIC